MENPPVFRQAAEMYVAFPSMWVNRRKSSVHTELGSREESAFCASAKDQVECILSIIRGNTAFPVLPIAHPVNAEAHRQGSSAVLG